MADTAIDTQQIQNALDQLTDVYNKLLAARSDALAAATMLQQAWQSTSAAPSFQRALSDIIGTDPNDPSEGGQAGADPNHMTVNVAVLINDVKAIMQYLQGGIADHTKADTSLTTGKP